jgi:hypothetical protein
MIELPEIYLIKALVQPQSMLSLITKTTKGANVLSAAFVAITRLRGELPRLEDIGFRYIPYVPAGDETGFYTAVCTPYVARRYDPHYLLRYTEAMDRTAQALAVELYETRACLYDALTLVMPTVYRRIHPEYILYPRRTELPPGVAWPAVGGSTPARGPLLLPQDRAMHQCKHGVQPPDTENRGLLRHLQMPGFYGFPDVDVACRYVSLLYPSTACLRAA